MKQKRLGGGARDSPTKDRYAGKRQQQQSGRGRGRPKAGSRGKSNFMYCIYLYVHDVVR